MKIIIIGAGELGQQLAARLSAADNDVIVIDTVQAEFKRFHEKLDIMTIQGDAISVDVMKRAGVECADILLAVSGDQASNILACQLASHLGVKRTICRIYSQEPFSPEDGVTPGFFGIGSAFSSPAECARHIRSILRHAITLDVADFSNPQATMVTVCIPAQSPLANVRLQDIPDRELLAHIRFAAIVRNHELKFPHGDTQLLAGDTVYVAGAKDHVEAFIQSASTADDTNQKLLVIGGATLLAKLVARDALESGMRIRVIEPDSDLCDCFLEDMPDSIQVIHGATTDEDTMKEAGVDQADAYADTEMDDENNILSSILAKRLGAAKVVSITHKPEYIRIVPELNAIDCGINTTIVSVNAVFRLMDTGTFRVDSQLGIFQAYLTEFLIRQDSRLIGKELRSIRLPQSVVLAMVFRGKDVLAPSGMTVFEQGDRVVAIVTHESEELLRPFFGRSEEGRKP